MEEVEESESIPIEMKIKAPITFVKNPKFKIQDLRENHYDKVIELIKHHYFLEEALCRSTKLWNDSKSLDTYLNIIKIWIHDTTSFVALSEKSGRVIGTAITRIYSKLDKTETYSTVQILEGQAINSIMDFNNTLIKEVNTYKTMDCDTYFRVYLLCVHPSYKTKGVAESLLLSCSRLAGFMKIPKVAGIFTTNADQLSAYKVGFQLHKEINYRKWVVNGKIIFTDPGPENLSAMFMSKSSEDVLKNHEQSNYVH